MAFNRPWTPDELGKVKDMIAKGVPSAVIAKEVGRTAVAIIHVRYGHISVQQKKAPSTRKCVRCGKDKTRHDFIGSARVCYDCKSKEQYEKERKRKEKEEARQRMREARLKKDEAKQKRCSRCGEVLPIDMFYRGRQVCKSCMKSARVILGETKKFAIEEVVKREPEKVCTECGYYPCFKGIETMSCNLALTCHSYHKL